MPTSTSNVKPGIWMRGAPPKYLRCGNRQYSDRPGGSAVMTGMRADASTQTQEGDQPASAVQVLRRNGTLRTAAAMPCTCRHACRHAMPHNAIMHAHAGLPAALPRHPLRERGLRHRGRHEQQPAAWQARMFEFKLNLNLRKTLLKGSRHMHVPNRLGASFWASLPSQKHIQGIAKVSVWADTLDVLKLCMQCVRQQVSSIALEVGASRQQVLEQRDEEVRVEVALVHLVQDHCDMDV